MKSGYRSFKVTKGLHILNYWPCATSRVAGLVCTRHQKASSLRRFRLSICTLMLSFCGHLLCRKKGRNQSYNPQASQDPCDDYVVTPCIYRKSQVPYDKRIPPVATWLSPPARSGQQALGGFPPAPAAPRQHAEPRRLH
jgi:hypothetical protein